MGVTATYSRIVSGVDIGQFVMHIWFIQIHAGGRMIEGLVKFTARPSRAPGGVVSFEDQIALGLVVDHG